MPPEQQSDHTPVPVNTNTVTSIFSSDIGHYVGQTNLDDQTKATLLQSPWLPPAHCVSSLHREQKMKTDENVCTKIAFR